MAATRAALEAAIADERAVDLAWITPAPTADGWTLAPDALRFLARLVEALKPKYILEFGSGLSTRMLARSCSDAGLQCRISSVDHDPEFGEAAIEPALPGVKVRVQVAPIVARDFGGKLLPQYLLNSRKLASRHSADLILVDGPPIALGGREGALYQAVQLSRPGTLVLLDDADRTSERKAIANLQDNLGGAIEARMLQGFTKGMAAIIVREPIPSDTLWQRKLVTAKVAIESVIPPGADFVMIGEDFWLGTWSDGRRSLPLVLRNGEAWDAPENDAMAISELQLREEAGATHLVLPWPSFWWLEYYGSFFTHLRASSSCVFTNDQLIIFELVGAGCRP